MEILLDEKRSNYKDIAIVKSANHTMKKWAHRGASAHAPENTLQIGRASCRERV